MTQASRKIAHAVHFFEQAMQSRRGLCLAQMYPLPNLTLRSLPRPYHRPTALPSVRASFWRSSSSAEGKVVQRGDVLLDLLDPRRARPGAGDARQAQDPGDGHLRQGLPAGLGDLVQAR